jgi:hypothetical protein
MNGDAIRCSIYTLGTQAKCTHSAFILLEQLNKTMRHGCDTMRDATAV